MNANIILTAALGLLTFGSCTQKSGTPKPAQAQVTTTNKKENKKMKPTELTVAEFKKKVMDFEKNPDKWVFEGDKPAIIDFYATWCGPCKATAPILEELAGDYEGKLDVYKVDVDKQQELAALFGIRSIPSLLFIPKEGKPQMQVGALNKAQFEQIIKETLLK